MEYVSKKYEIVIFCGGSQLYCTPVLNFIEEKRKYFAHYISNDYVLFDNANFTVKYYDFLLHKPRTLKNTVIMESHVATYSLLLYSGIPVSIYKSICIADKELIEIAKFLDILAESEDINKTIRQKVQEAIY